MAEPGRTTAVRYITPPWVIRLCVEAEGRPFDLDVCTGPEEEAAWRAAGLDVPPAYHGLGERRGWAGHIWCNPPYGRGLVRPWVERWAGHRGGAAWLLTRAAVGSRWWHHAVEAADVVLLPRRRVCFALVRADGTLDPGTAPPWGVSLLYRGGRPEQVRQAWAEHATVMDLRRG